MSLILKDYNLLLSFFLIIIYSCSSELNKIEVINGFTFGTTFTIQVESNLNKNNLKTSIDSLLNIINLSMSTYIPNSDISKINRGDTLLVVDYHFKKVFLKSYDLWHQSNGFFDPSVGSLVNAYGFGPEKKIEILSDKKIDSLLKLTGFYKISLTKKGTIKKKPPNIYIDFNALAKGYTLDIIGDFLDDKKTENYLIEIGGEILAKGKNPNTNKYWKIAIDNPSQSKTPVYIKTLSLNNKALATSGNYRKYRIDSLTGKKHVHSINPINGKSEISKIISVSVIANDCMTADAWATTLMIMPIEMSKPIIENLNEIDAFWILSDEIGFKEVYSQNWPNF